MMTMTMTMKWRMSKRIPLYLDHFLGNQILAIDGNGHCPDYDDNVDNDDDEHNDDDVGWNLIMVGFVNGKHKSKLKIIIDNKVQFD